MKGNMKGKGVIIIKLGGSCFSDKKIPRSLHVDVIDSISTQLKESGIPCIIVHGGGSYGHPVAKKYAIQHGRQQGIPDQEIGFCETHQAMAELNMVMIAEFLHHGLLAYPAQTSAMFVLENGGVKSANISAIDAMLDEGFMPVLYGDAVIDVSRGFGIMSGDAIVVELANRLTHPVTQIVYLTDVDGIFDKNPKLDPDAVLFPEIIVRDGVLLAKRGKELVPVEKAITQADSTIDVTGGILNKVRELRRVKAEKIAISILNGRSTSRLAALLLGAGSVPQTRITIEHARGIHDGKQ
jgi:isopentenyl phosphate kinase